MRTWTTTIRPEPYDLWSGPGDAWVGTTVFLDSRIEDGITEDSGAALDYVEAHMLEMEKRYGIVLVRPPVVWLEDDAQSGRRCLRFAGYPRVGTAG